MKKPLAIVSAPKRAGCQGAVAPAPPNAAPLVQRFKALADETRLLMLRQLRCCEEICACDFVACCGLAQPTISHHLKVLREAGLVTAEKRGLWVYYRLNRVALEELRALLP